MRPSQVSQILECQTCESLIHNRSVYEFYSQGDSYEQLHERNRASAALWSRYIPNTSFKFLVTAYSHKILQTRQREIVESFSYMGLLGKIDMNDPEITFGCFEECTWF
jgi:tRNA (guanine10-N2)-methyltransferase